MKQTPWMPLLVALALSGCPEPNTTSESARSNAQGSARPEGQVAPVLVPGRPGLQPGMQVPPMGDLGGGGDPGQPPMGAPRVMRGVGADGGSPAFGPIQPGEGLPSAVGPNATLASPYSPYPMSFPKMLAGILYWEYEKPEMQVTQAQAQQLIEPVSLLSKSWQGVLYAEDAVKYALTCEQLKFTGSNKQRFERGDSPTRNRMRPVADRYVIYEVGAALGLLRERVKTSDSTSFTPCPKEKLVEKGASIDMGGSFTDVAAAILAMDTQPTLRVGAQQAIPLLKIFEDAAKAERTTVVNEERIRNTLTKEQIRAIGQDIIPITHMKQRWAGGMSGQQSDPLTTRSLEILEARAAGKPVPPKPLPEIHGDTGGPHILSDPPAPPPGAPPGK